MSTRIGMISLGCSKNLVDSEVMLGLLKENGYQVTPQEKNADILIINTCAFIEDAKLESMEIINQLTRFRSKRKIIVAGCLAQRYADQLHEKFDGKIHAIVGTGDFNDILKACKAVLAEKDLYKRVSKSPNYIYDHNTPRLLTTPDHFAYVKIAEGCDNCCSYCVIPQLRGRYRSRPIESIAAEVSSLAKFGVREVILIAQDTTYYGMDKEDGTNLPSLLKRLAQIPEIQWIRVLYGHPEHIGDEFLKLMAEEEKICSYIDIPIQHINSEILKNMGRRTTDTEIRDLINKIRSIIPEVTLRTSIIVGFPGETEEQFKELMRFVEYARFDHLGVFAYSAEEGTAALNIADHIPEPVKEERVNKIAEIHEQISKEKRQSLVGRKMLAIVDKVDKEQTAVGRTQGQAPEIDDVTFIVDNNVKRGEFVSLEIIDTYETFDLIGSVIQ